jgi:uncharacterized RDD family membrane protein YckC/predicted RNA-binding Zn ribbon-like protein
MASREDEREDSGLGRVMGRLVGGVVNPVVGQLDVDRVVERVDINELLDRIDVNAVFDRIEPDPVLDRIEPNRLLDRVDPDRLLDRVDADRLLDRVDPNRLLDRVDPNRLLDRVDANRLLDRVDPNRLLDRVDANRLLDRVDANRLLDRVDANRLLERVDVNALVERTELQSIIARSTSGVFSGLLDVVRTRVMLVDQVVHGVVRRARGRTGRVLPPGPNGLDEQAIEPGLELGYADRAVMLQHRYSGSVSRFLGFLLDQFVIGVLYTIGAFLVAAALRIVVGYEPDPDAVAIPVVISYALWWTLYNSASLAASGQTIGKAIAGVRVVRADGEPLGGRRALVRTLAFPLSFLSFGIGFLIGLFRVDRRELHDLIAGSAVIYDWDAETTRLRSDDTGEHRQD